MRKQSIQIQPSMWRGVLSVGHVRSAEGGVWSVGHVERH